MTLPMALGESCDDDWLILFNLLPYPQDYYSTLQMKKTGLLEVKLRPNVADPESDRLLLSSPL